MDYKIAACSDAGRLKKVNQDAFLVKIAATAAGKVCLCVVCDGVGGLSKGELASGTLVRAFDRWFEEDFAEAADRGADPQLARTALCRVILEQNRRLWTYGIRSGAPVGTTVTALLLAGGAYYILNVGDSRAYVLDGGIRLLTRDQTCVQYALDQGHITQREARRHPARHVLLQCVGAAGTVSPDFYYGPARPGAAFVLCTDGLCNRALPEEIYSRLNPAVVRSEADMADGAAQLVGLVKRRGENDNISVAAVRICGEG